MTVAEGVAEGTTVVAREAEAGDVVASTVVDEVIAITTVATVVAIKTPIPLMFPTKARSPVSAVAHRCFHSPALW